MTPLRHKRYLVTGGAGFIGSHIAEEISRQDKYVRVLDNFATGRHENIIPWYRFDVGVVDADVTDYEAIRPWFEDIDVVFHLACSKCTVCRKDPLRDLMVNAYGSMNVFRAAHEAGVKRIVHASTGSVYGESCGYGDAFRPLSFYGVSKLAGESYLRAFLEYGANFSYAVARYFHVYGPRQDASDEGGVIPIFIRNVLEGEPITIYGDGSQKRYFTHVKDNVDANFILANGMARTPSACDIAADRGVSILELAHMVCKTMGSADHPIIFEDWRLGDIRDFEINTRAIKAAGATFDRSFEAGLAQTIEWYVSMRQKDERLEKARTSARVRYAMDFSGFHDMPGVEGNLLVDAGKHGPGYDERADPSSGQDRNFHGQVHDQEADRVQRGMGKGILGSQPVIQEAHG